MAEALLLGGPHDSAAGPADWAGALEIFVSDGDPEFPEGANNLIICANRGKYPDEFRYVLTSRAEEKYIYSYSEGDFGQVLEDPEEVRVYA